MVNKYMEEAAYVVDMVRKQNPLVDCITNVVTVNDCANILLAFGASPAMCDSFSEAYNFAGISSALYINLGTFHQQQEAGAVQAALAARKAGIPIVVDPVGCAAIPSRIVTLNHLREIAGVDVIKGNMGEIMALAGLKADVKGVDSSGDVIGIEKAAASVAKKFDCVTAASGKVDVITDGSRLARISNGAEMLTKITGAGCMLGALCAATAALTAATNGKRDLFSATAAAFMAMGIAGEMALEQAKLPGSYRVALIDSIFAINGKMIFTKGKLQC